MNSARKIFLLVFFISLVYAVLRYHVFGNVDWGHFPLYVLNKAVALSGFLMLIFSSMLSHTNNRIKKERDMIGFGSLALILIHVLISLVILGPEYYPKFYGPEGKMNLTGEFSMVSGVLGLVFMWMVNRYFSLSAKAENNPETRKQFKNLIYLAAFAGFVHAVVMGFKSWITPRDWFGYLPPITVLAAAGFLIWLFLLFRNRKIT